MAKELKFTCPHCGGHKLVTIEHSIEQYPVDSVTMDGNKIKVDYSDDMDSMLDHWKEYFACGDCGEALVIIKDYNTLKVQTETQLKRWFKENTPK